MCIRDRSHDSESVLSAIDVDGKGQLTLDEQRVESVYRHPGSGQYFLVLIQGGGRLASGSLGTHGLEARVPGPGQSLSLIHISEPTRPYSISYAVFCLKKKTTQLQD